MKFNTIIRAQLVLVAMVAALFMASSVYAQQDMDPTSFPDGPGVTNFSQPVRADASLNAVNTFTMDANNSGTQAASYANSTPVDEAGVAQWTSVDMWAATSLMIAMGVLVLYGALQRKRDERQISYGPRTLTPSNVTAR